MKRIFLPLKPDVIQGLQMGEQVLLSGPLYTGRDAACQRLVASRRAGEKLPIPLAGETMYFVGPCPARPGQVIGSAGPTTSYRMDPFTPELLEAGLKGMIGKGPRSSAVVESIVRHRAVYFAAIGGAGALMARSIKKAEIVAYEDLGTEAIRRLVVDDMPVIVAVDAMGNDIYRRAQKLGGEKVNARTQ